MINLAFYCVKQSVRLGPISRSMVRNQTFLRKMVQFWLYQLCLGWSSKWVLIFSKKKKKYWVPKGPFLFKLGPLKVFFFVTRSKSSFGFTEIGNKKQFSELEFLNDHHCHIVYIFCSNYLKGKVKNGKQPYVINFQYVATSSFSK